MTGAAAIALAVELAPLSPLKDWQPVAELVEEVLSALRGHGSLSDRDIQRIRRWARRWPRLHPVLREWYAEVAPKDARASRALLWLLTSGGELPPDSLRWAARAAMVEWTGREPAFDPLPRMRDDHQEQT